MKDCHDGWTVTGPHMDAPVTGRYSASRYGVHMGANDLGLMIRMIDLRMKREREDGRW